jgi:hypothetical protein
MTANDIKTARELAPFILRRMEAGETFEAALVKSADDAKALCEERREQLLDSVYSKLTA